MLSKSLLLKISVISPALFALICLVPYLIYYKRRRAVLKLKTPKYTNPLAGHLQVIPKDLYESILWTEKEMNKPEHLKQGVVPIVLGFLPTLLTYDPKIVSEVVSGQKHSVKNINYESLVPWLGRGLLIANGEKWKQRRKLTTPAFHFEVLKRFVDVMNEQGDVMVDRIGQDLNNPVDFFEYVTLCALDVICETAMGKKINAQNSSGKNQYVNAVYDMSTLAYDRIMHPYLLIDFIYKWTKNGKKHEETLKILHGFTLGVIHERRQYLKEHPEEDIGRKPAFLDLLLTSNVDGVPLSDEDIREEVDTFMFEGHDTTSASLAWTIYLLGHHPEIQDKLREEVNQVVGDSSFVTVEMMSKLKYMEIVLKESLRLYPSVPGISRVLTEDIEVDGHKILKGTDITISIYFLHRNPSYWESPNEFKPERWETSGDIEKRNPFMYIPFSAGLRNCIGQNFAKYEEKVLLSKIIQNFRFTSLETVKISPEIILRPTDGVKVKFEKLK